MKTADKRGKEKKNLTILNLLLKPMRVTKIFFWKANLIKTKSKSKQNPKHL